MKIGLFGKGRLGSAIAAEIGRTHDDQALREGSSFGSPFSPSFGPSFDLAWAEGREECAREGADLAIDASALMAVESHLEWALAHGVDLVIAATGWNNEASGLSDLALRVDGRIGVLVAPNLSPGAALMRKMAALMGGFAASEPESDIAICEWHHRGKTDAPSGTAKSLADAAAGSCPRYSGWNSGSWQSGRINIASLRAGYEIGRHEMVLDAPFESLSLVHVARDLRVFASGALKAACWLHGRKGVFTMDDFAAVLLGGFGRAGSPEGV